ncbi:papilin-like isoform X2 [Montipora capricornis]|uniref:papilin-like isoform X2 n=1 Tax=Montipora capricornis TaxID=246305 RepID=UPI0035F0FD3C
MPLKSFPILAVCAFLVNPPSAVSDPVYGDICALPKKPGPCKAYIPRWFYNTAKAKCERFIYGGCQKNANNFITKDECDEACSAERICGLPSETGPCRAYIRRYFYSKTSGKCEMFIYGGCLGNSNNFPTLELCQEKCQESGDICALPKKPGPCKAHMPRWFYNTAKAKCERFIYGGCKKNANNFITKYECDKTCSAERICGLPSETGPCRAYNPRYFYSKTSGKCEMFIYGGCAGNSNNFPTLELCQEKCQESGDMCALPKKPGPCKVYMPRWFYNTAKAKCERFIYGGCQKNANNFITKDECDETCSAERICGLPSETGPCKAYVPSYFYNKISEKCEKFIYGGCQGNSNNFPTLELCQEKCQESGDICALPKKPGPCLAYMPRWFYNTAKAKCERFIYGGCQENANNFMTKDECNETCSAERICGLPSETGPCRAYFPRYLYNKTSEKCEKFIYGGCAGNSNNFPTLELCQEKCQEMPGSFDRRKRTYLKKRLNINSDGDEAQDRRIEDVVKPFVRSRLMEEQNHERTESESIKNKKPKMI